MSTRTLRSSTKATNNKRKASEVEKPRAVSGAGEPDAKAPKIEEKPAAPATTAAAAAAAAPQQGWLSSIKNALQKVTGTVSTTLKDQAGKAKARRDGRVAYRQAKGAAIKQRLSNLKLRK